MNGLLVVIVWASELKVQSSKLQSPWHSKAHLDTSGYF